MHKILTIIGARPQFIKASAVSNELLKHPELQEVIVHTGQHFDENMSSVFFDELEIPRPRFQLDVNGGSHGAMTGNMLIRIEEVLFAEKPDYVLVYGDTNSTLAGALAASKLHIPVIHVEAGLRSFNMKMPEEINRIMTDMVSSILFCPTEIAVANLENEGFASKPVHLEEVGDVMLDAALLFKKYAKKPDTLPSLDTFVLATVHRAENTDDPAKLAEIVEGLNRLHADIPVVLPLHPRTRKMLSEAGLQLHVETIPPVGYLEMLWLLNKCSLVMTDSGGVQKEAFFFQKPCVTLRDQTEWVELIDMGVNTLSCTCRSEIEAKARQMLATPIRDLGELYGGGMASRRIAKTIIAQGL